MFMQHQTRNSSTFYTTLYTLKKVSDKEVTTNLVTNRMSFMTSFNLAQNLQTTNKLVGSCKYCRPIHTK
jgi:hypothetical protein